MACLQQASPAVQEQMQLLGGMPFGNQIPASSFIDIDSTVSEESRTQALELRFG